MRNALGNNLHTSGAPAGDALAVAKTILRTSPQPCGRVRSAERQGDDSIRATCSNGEVYRLFVIEGMEEPTALRCTAAADLGVSGC